MVGKRQVGPCQVLLGMEDLANEPEEDKGRKQVLGEGLGVTVDHKSW